MNFLAFSSAVVLLPMMQAGGETATSLYAKEPTTWTLEYPVLIEPFVDDYYNCLKSGLRTVRIEPEFEAQHRTDVPRCADVKLTAIADANAMLARRGNDAETPPASVVQTFEKLQSIHIARGRDLDDHIRLRAEARDRYWAAHRDAERARVVTEIDLDIVAAPPKIISETTGERFANTSEDEFTNATN